MNSVYLSSVLIKKVLRRNKKKIRILTKYLSLGSKDAELVKIFCDVLLIVNKSSPERFSLLTKLN